MIKMKISVERTISYISILMIICICAFLTAKYIVRSRIDTNEIPIDTSVRM